MKLIAFAAMLLVAVPAAAQTGKTAAGVTAPNERLPTDVRRLTILVRDMENGLKRYHQIIGLPVVTTSG